MFLRKYPANPVQWGHPAREGIGGGRSSSGDVVHHCRNNLEISGIATGHQGRGRYIRVRDATVPFCCSLRGASLRCVVPTLIPLWEFAYCVYSTRTNRFRDCMLTHHRYFLDGADENMSQTNEAQVIILQRSPRLSLNTTLTMVPRPGTAAARRQHKTPRVSSRHVFRIWSFGVSPSSLGR